VTSDPIARYLSQRTAKFDRRTRLRTMTNNEIVDFSLRAYQMLGVTFLKLTALPSLFCLAALAFVTEYILPQMFVTKDASSQATQIGEVVMSVGLALLIGGPLFLIGLSYSTALVTQLMADYMVGNVPSPEAARQSAKRSLGSLLRSNLRTLLVSSSGLLLSIGLLILSSYAASVTPENSTWVGLVVLLGIGGVIAGGVVFIVVIGFHALNAPVVVVEHKKGRDVPRRSRELMKGTPYIPSGYNIIANVYVVLLFVSAGMLFGLYASLGMLNYEGNAQALVLSLPFGPILLKAIEMLPLYLFVWTMIPVWAVIVTVIYFERRVRVEGYDIEALAGDVWRTDRQNRFEL
jgi:hypothetical protein